MKEGRQKGEMICVGFVGVIGGWNGDKVWKGRCLVRVGQRGRWRMHGGNVGMMGSRVKEEEKGGVGMVISGVTDTEVDCTGLRLTELEDVEGLREKGGELSQETPRWQTWEFLWPRGLILVIAAIWGTNFGSVKWLQDVMPASLAAAIRFSIATSALAPAVWKARNNPDVLRGGLIAGIPVTLGYLSQAVALGMTEANKGAFLCSLAVIVVPFIERFVLSRYVGSSHKLLRCRESDNQTND